MPTRPQSLYFAAGAVIFLMLHLYFVLSWDALYAPHPWLGYAPGVSPPFFTSSPRSLWLAAAVLFVAALGLTLLPAGREQRTAVALWVGVMSAIILVWLATARIRQDSNMWPIDFLFLAVMTGVPMLAGWAIGLAYWRIRTRHR
jgi:hypothetical protein